MSKVTNTITLESKPTQRIVKRLALLAFSTIRNTANNTAQIPNVLTVAASDVRDAWRETANLKV